MKPPLCPKCRALGLDTDCADLLHPQGRTMDDETYELEVMFSFPLMASTDGLADPAELAGQLRERWIENPMALVYAMTDAVNDDDFALRVTPIFGS